MNEQEQRVIDGHLRVAAALMHMHPTTVREHFETLIGRGFTPQDAAAFLFESAATPPCAGPCGPSPCTENPGQGRESHRPSTTLRERGRARMYGRPRFQSVQRIFLPFFFRVLLASSTLALAYLELIVGSMA
jgi:hypothetical protein